MNSSANLEPVAIEQIMALLPHRYPFLLIDRVTDYSLDEPRHITAIKNVTINEPFFNGHFPGHPVMPGVLIVEAMAQAAGVLAHLVCELENKPKQLYYLAKVDNAKFNQIVVPGDQLELKIKQKRIMRNLGQYSCQAYVQGKRVASAELLCAGKSES